MKILAVVDKIPSAIAKCALAGNHLKKWITYDIVAVHPKRPSVEQLEEFRSKAWEADVIDFQYWKSAVNLIDLFPFLKDKPKILTHHNPYDVELENWWEKFDEVIVKNKTQQAAIQNKFNKSPIYIPHTIDLDFFKFQREYPSENVFKVIMVAARIEPSKGILEVAKACRKTKTNFILVGRISDMNYMQEIMHEAGNYIDFRSDISEEELRDSYYEAHLLINNSKDGFESGTMPHLEAMACGTPVLTRNVGLVPDINNGKNMVVRSGEKEDVDEIAEYIEKLKGDRKQRLQLRENAFGTILDRDDEYTALRYYRIYRQVKYKQKLVSIIIPTYNRADVLQINLLSIARQTYQNIEVIVVDDGSTDNTKEVVDMFKEESDMVIKYIKLEKDGYGLAKARNMGVMEASGEILIFVDDRYSLDGYAVDKFVSNLLIGHWVFGCKGFDKKSFVENFSCIYKKDLARIGMFNERINIYGGMTRDLTCKMRYNNIKSVYCPEAKATVLVDSKSRYTKKAEIIKAKLLLYKLWGID